MKRIALVCVLFFITAIAAGGGYSVEGSRKNIVGGQETDDDEFPFVAKILYRRSCASPLVGSCYPIGCTGSLVAPNKVLTAAHCVSGYEDDPWKINVGFGSSSSEYGVYKLSGSSSEIGEDYMYRVVEISVHENFCLPDNDVAVLWLDYDVGIEPVRILTLDEERRWYASSDRRGVAVGWGRLGAGSGAERPDTLRKVEVPIYTRGDCEDALQDLRDQGKSPQAPRILEQMLCAGEGGPRT